MKQKIVYCHFSFRRPKNKNYGLFAVALYSDEDGKRLIATKTRAFTLWENHQHITAIQSYEHALQCIWEWQGKLKEHNVTNILLVTDNSTLAGWIQYPSKNKYYKKWMHKATEQYRVGAIKELYIPVGLCEPRYAEKSHKYCKEELLVNSIPSDNTTKPSGYKLDIKGYKSVMDIINEDKPEGLDSVKLVGQ